jgi:hypothetical protein
MFCRTYSQVVALLRKDDKPYEKVLFASLSPNLFMPHAVPIDKLSPKSCTASAIIAVLFVSQPPIKLFAESLLEVLTQTDKKAVVKLAISQGRIGPDIGGVLRKVKNRQNFIAELKKNENRDQGNGSN